MKFPAALFSLVVLTASAMYGQRPAPAGQPASFGEESTLLHRPTPTPAAVAKADSKDKKPLSATLGKDNTGKKPMTTFSSVEPKIYLIWQDGAGAKGDKVRTVWYAEDTGGKVSKNKKLSETVQVVPEAGATGSSFVSPPVGGFPPGKYRADLYDGAKLAQSLKFTVTK